MLTIHRLVQHEKTEWVAEPTAEDLGLIMSAVFEDSARAKNYGHNARALWESMKINWPETVETLFR